MKKIFLSLLASLPLLSTVGCSDAPGDPICKYLNEATEKMKEASSMNEVKNINDRLIYNVGTYAQTLPTEDYQKWAEDSVAQKEMKEAQQRYNEVKEAKISTLSKK